MWPAIDGGSLQGPFYDLEFNFSNDIDHFSILALDADEAVSAHAYLGATLVDSVSFAAGSDLQVYDLDLGTIGGALFDRVVVDIVAGSSNNSLGGPEYFDNLSFSVVESTGVPVPASVFLLLGGLGLIRLQRSNKC